MKTNQFLNSHSVLLIVYENLFFGIEALHPLQSLKSCVYKILCELKLCSVQLQESVQCFHFTMFFFIVYKILFGILQNTFWTKGLAQCSDCNQPDCRTFFSVYICILLALVIIRWEVVKKWKWFRNWTWFRKWKWKWQKEELFVGRLGTLSPPLAFWRPNYREI